MKTMYPVIAQDGMTSANQRAGLSRAIPLSETGQRGLTSANTQAGLAAPPAPAPAPTPASSGGAASGESSGAK